MNLKTLRLAACFCLLLAENWQARSQENHLTKVTKIPYVFKAQTLEGRVKEAVETGGFPALSQLFDENKNNLDEVFSYLKLYVHAPNLDVQLSLIDAASLAPERPEAIAFLSELSPDENIGPEAIRTLYNHYDRSQIIERGGTRLRTALLRGAISSRYTTRGYLLLSCFKPTPDILNFLHRRRASFKPFPSEKLQAPPSVPDRTHEIISLDLALGEMGDGEALQHIKDLFRRNNTKEVMALLQYSGSECSEPLLSEAQSTLSSFRRSSHAYIAQRPTMREAAYYIRNRYTSSSCATRRFCRGQLTC